VGSLGYSNWWDNLLYYSFGAVFEGFEMNQFGPSEDCIVCGQATNEFRRCHGCETTMCNHCCTNHDCREINDKRFEDFINKIDEPLSEAFGKLGYNFNGECEKDGWRIYEFDSLGNPTIELRVSKRI
jgi:hypothetical protein